MFLRFSTLFPDLPLRSSAASVVMIPSSADFPMSRSPDFPIHLCVPSCPLSSRAFGPRKRMKIGFSTLWFKFFPISGSVLIRVYLR
jgi:hypothetical protein